ncbi:hypothetical protein SAMN05660284_00088 [Formivibrio citricus]|uniref:Uncharacterized protein n=1 Tax=Formivibrio citricus TaxID=83765 RepID=A0A1I4V2C6_9NEIS|nr:hypothetical protein SAMN05660284_00088 [Formivibrio citricus]
MPHGAYVGKERSNKGKWKMEEGFSYFEERGIFKNNAFIMACENKNACEDMVREPYRAEFRNAASSSELNGFIEKYKDNDPDGLVPQARKKIPAAQKYEREQERLAAIKRAKEEREAYRTAFKNASSSSDLSAFVERYKNNDPEKLVPKARQKISAAQKRERDQSAKQEREYAARLAQECGRLYPGKLVSWTAKMCEGRVLGLFGGGCYDEKFQGIIVGGGKGIATAKITKPSHKSGEYSERSCSDFN